MKMKMHVKIRERETKAALTKMLRLLNAYVSEEETSPINNLSSHLKEPEKEEQNEPKTNRMKEMIKERTEINETENRKTRGKQCNKELVL